MKLLSVIAAGLVLSGCASAQPTLSSADSLKLTFNLYGDKDDLKERAGSGTFVLLEKGDDGRYAIVEFAKSRMPIGNERQEQLFVSNSYSNLAPAWNEFNMTYVENPKSGERRDYRFDCNQTDLQKYKKSVYSPCNSAFASYVNGNAVGIAMSGVVHYEVRGLHTTLIAKVASEADVLAKTREFDAGAPSRPPAAKVAAAPSAPIAVGETWLVRPRNAGDTGRFLFRPESFQNKGDVITAERALKISYMPGIFRTAITPYSELNGYKVQKRSADNSCTDVNFKFKAGQDVDGTWCGGREEFIFRAYNVEKWIDVTEVVGFSKKLYGGNWERRTMIFTVGGIDELSFLTTAQSAKYD
jgi:hypothetical protein